MVSFVEAWLHLRPRAGGGRRNPVFSGYRAGWQIPHRDGEPTNNDGPIELVDAERLALGETGLGRIRPIAPESWRDLMVGDEIEMREGQRIVGVAKVMALHLEG